MSHVATRPSSKSPSHQAGQTVINRAATAMWNPSAPVPGAAVPVGVTGQAFRETL